jgi:putative peptide zinc metalloprotease protein
MTAPLVSGSWFRVASLKPSLAPGLSIVRQRVRDQVWHVLVDPGSGRQMRLNPSAYAFVARCDGRATVDSVWQQRLAQQGDAAPSQEEVLRLLAQLFHSGMLHFDSAPHLSLLFARRDEAAASRRRAFVNPLMVRVPLFDPTRLLDRLAPLAAQLLTWRVFALWMAAVLVAALAAAVGFGPLKADAVRVMATPSCLAIAWVAYPLVKSLHELGHALVVRAFGGAVHEVGVSLLLLTPAPYVDASAANTFPRGPRALVSAAGIMVELALAALAMLAWSLLAPGLLRDTAMVVLLICSISTLVFNANPLLRLDGYHLLCDALQLPNLSLRSQAWWAAAWRRVAGADASLPAGTLARGEAKWLILYAPASWAWRLVLLFAVVLWLGEHSWLLGMVAGFALVAWLAGAVVRGWLRSAGAAPDAQARRRVLAFGAVGALAAGVVLFVVPAPANVVAHGVVWPPERAQLRADAGGFVEALAMRNGEPVAVGDVVLTLSDPDLVARHEKTVSEHGGLLAQQYQALLQDPARAADLDEQVGRNAAELERVEEQLAALVVRAGSEGRVVLPREQDLPGSYARRGAMLGYVLGPGQPAHVRLVLADEDLLRVRGRVRSVEVRLAHEPWTAHAAQLASETPAATRQLPSAALGDRNGGAIAVDPADKDGVRTQRAVFVMDVAVPGLAAGHIGSRARVKLALPPEPLGWQAVRTVRQLLLRHFSPTAQA